MKGLRVFMVKRFSVRSFLIALIFISQAIVAGIYPPECSFSQHQDERDDSDSVVTVVKCHIQDQEVGTVSYMKLPMLNRYIMLSLYVEPEYRNKGYGSALLAYACDCIKATGAKCVYLQPGPFELSRAPEGYLTTTKPTGPMLAKKLEHLMAFYKKNGFVPAEQWLIPLVCLAYALMEIEEDADLLVVKDLE
jgi:GNAT superfamily N-acetyltransferase